MTYDERNREHHVRQLVHNIRDCLHAIGMGIELLKDARDDGRRFSEICKSIDQERQEAARLVGQFVRTPPNEEN